jgi:hypothetical protein
MVPVVVMVPPVIAPEVAIEVTVPVVLEVPAPIAVRNDAASKDETVLSALNLGKVTALGLEMVNRLAPRVVAPRLARPVDAVRPVEPPSHFSRSVYAESQFA